MPQKSEMTPVAEMKSSFKKASFVKKDDIWGWGPGSIATFHDPEVGAFAIVKLQPRRKGCHLFVLNESLMDDMPSLVLKVASCLGVPRESFRWQAENGQMASLAPV